MGRTASSRVLAVVSGVLLLACGIVAFARSSPAELDPAQRVEELRPTPSAQPARAGVLTDQTTLYAHDFHADPAGANPPAGWEMTGAWNGVTEDGGHVLSHSSGTRLGVLLAGSPAWSDYQVAANVKVLTPRSGFAGLVGRFQTSGDYYECVIHHDESVQLWRLRNGQGMEIGGTESPIDITQVHRLALSLEGGRVMCSLDWVIKASVTDAALPMGRPGLIASSGEAAEFDDVTVTARVAAASPGSSPASGARGTPTPPASTPPETATPAATPTPPAATPSPPAPAASRPAIVRAPERTARGTSTTVGVHTTPGAACSLSLGSAVAAAQAKGLGALTADPEGNATWTWKVGALTPRGAVPVAIRCAGMTVETTVTVV